MLYAIIAVLVILADQLIKIYVTTDGFQPIQLIPGVLDLGINGGDPNALHYVQNNGGAFGLLGGQIPTFWFIVIAGVFTVLVILALSTKFIRGFLARWSIVLVTAGGISNCIDRVINVKPDGHVVDMFLFPFTQKADGTYWFPVFNLADVFITVFCILFILAILFGRSPKSSADEDEFDEDEEEEDLVEEEEKVRPSRRSRKSRKDEYEEEEDEEEEVRRPAAKVERKSRKARQSKYDEEYEQYKAAQRAREEAEKAAAPAPVEPAPAEEPIPAAPAEEPVFDPADPFAEWERANAARKPAPAFVPAQTAPEAVEEPVRPSRRSELKAEPQPAAPAEPEQPAVPEPPVVRPARKPAPVVEEPASFDLDDILAEFK